MPTQNHPLIDSITKPLADNAELKLSAERILEQTFDPEHPSVPQAIERLEARDKKKFPALGKILLWVLALAGLGLGIYADREAMRMLIKFDRMFGFSEPLIFSHPAGLTAQEQLLLGDPELDALRQKELLLESDPTHPAYYAEYAQAYESTKGVLPPDFLETAARIDPENSFFPYWAAGVIIKDSLERLPKTSSQPPRYVDGVKLRSLPTPTEYAIKDQAAYDEALAWVKKASALPKFENYEIKMMKARMRLVAPCNSFAGFLRAIMIQYQNPSSGVMPMMKVSNLMDARADELSKKGQKEDFLLLAAQRDAFLYKWAHAENANLVSELVYNAIASGTAFNFHTAADRLGLTEIAETYRKQSEGFTAERDRRDLRQKKDDKTERFIHARASSLSRLALPMVGNQVQSPPPLDDNDLKPLRMAEHEVLGRIGIFSVALILLLTTLFVFLFRFLAPKAVRQTAKRIACLLKISDWAWIFSLGVALPVLVFLYIQRLSPVSGRDYGSSHFLFVFPGLHLSACLLALLLAPAVVVRWRLTRRAAAFKFGSRLDLLSLPVLGAIVICSLVAYPVLVKFNLNKMTQIFLLAPLVGWLGFVFFNGLRIFLGSARSRIIQAATAIAVIPAYPLAILALCLAVPPYFAGEKHWLPQDKLHLVDPDAPDLGAYELKVAAQKRKETNAILGIK
jgi:hypothetical protein